MIAECRISRLAYQQRRFGGSPDALGRKITLNDSPCEVIGVMPREFYLLPARDIDFGDCFGSIFLARHMQ